jgi:polysaccharide export outer membrane protein
VRRVLVAPVVAAAVVASVSVPSAQQPDAPAGRCAAEYVIGPEDVLDVAVWNNADISRTVPVRPDGKISLPLLNDVQASGFTPMQVRDALSESLATYIASPNVSVIVREIHSFKVTVIGEVKLPGRYELKGRSTVVDVLAIAGGLTEFAAHRRIVVLRQDAAGTRQIPFPYHRLTAKTAASAAARDDDPRNFCVRPGDVVLVP